MRQAALVAREDWLPGVAHMTPPPLRPRLSIDAAGVLQVLQSQPEHDERPRAPALEVPRAWLRALFHFKKHVI